jgi:hypothetical protein
VCACAEQGSLGGYEGGRALDRLEQYMRARVRHVLLSQSLLTLARLSANWSRLWSTRAISARRSRPDSMDLKALDARVTWPFLSEEI